MYMYLSNGVNLVKGNLVKYYYVYKYVYTCFFKYAIDLLDSVIIAG